VEVMELERVIAPSSPIIWTNGVIFRAVPDLKSTRWCFSKSSGRASGSGHSFRSRNRIKASTSPVCHFL
jgi:hypothetical protein